jgi:putative membrane protein insertion efficiency factor
VYQHTLSPDHSWVRHRYPGGYCRFAPTCSSYAVHALRKDGVVALPAIVWRVARCHPWNAGGIDPYLALSQDAVLRPKP